MNHENSKPIFKHQNLDTRRYSSVHEPSLANSSKECYGVGLTQCSSIKSAKKAWCNYKVSYWSNKKYSNFSSTSNLEIPFSFPVISLKRDLLYILGKTRRLPLYLMVYIQGYFVFNQATFLNITKPPKKEEKRSWLKTMGKKSFLIFTEKINIQSRTVRQSLSTYNVSRYF